MHTAGTCRNPHHRLVILSRRLATEKGLGSRDEARWADGQPGSQGDSTGAARTLQGRAGRGGCWACRPEPASCLAIPAQPGPNTAISLPSDEGSDVCVAHLVVGVPARHVHARVRVAGSPDARARGEGAQMPVVASSTDGKTAGGTIDSTRPQPDQRCRVRLELSHLCHRDHMGAVDGETAVRAGHLVQPRSSKTLKRHRLDEERRLPAHASTTAANLTRKRRGSNVANFLRRAAVAVVVSRMAWCRCAGGRPPLEGWEAGWTGEEGTDGSAEAGIPG